MTGSSVNTGVRQERSAFHPFCRLPEIIELVWSESQFFVGALRDLVRNIGLFQFGMIACVLVVPYALVFGGLRGIPIQRRLIDCAFGGLGFGRLRFADG